MTEWSIAPLSSVLSDVRPGFATGDDLDEGIFQVRMNNITVDGQFDLRKKRRVSLNGKSHSNLMVECGDVLFNATNSPELVGKSAFVSLIEEPTTFSNHFLRLRPFRDKLDGSYLARWLHVQFQMGRFRGLCRQWVNQATVSRESLLGLEIPLPSIAEQRHIAAILDQADALRAKRREALAQLDSLTQSIFIEMFGDPKKLTSDGQCRELSDIVAPGKIVTYGIVQAGPEVENGVPYIRTGDIKNGEILEHQLARTSYEIASSYSRSAISAGDIVMSIRATVGTTALVPESLEGANLTQGTARISPGPEVRSEYLISYLRTDSVQAWIQSQVKGATFREITLGKLRQLPVFVPALSLQIRFVRQIDAVNTLKAANRKSLIELDALFTCLQHRAFRGEL